MANPNIVNVTSIYGKTKGVALDTTLTTALLANGNGSNKLLKLNSIIISNIDGTNAAEVTISMHDGSNDYYLAKTVTVPADSTLIVLGKDAPIYLEENQTVRGGASNGGDLHCIISYEELDDA
tara:strand:- start:1563 stop:1931 length:369 start_codon:yes stop_codon:yes gene_type:complete